MPGRFRLALSCPGFHNGRRNVSVKTMSLAAGLSLFAIMLVLAAVPSTSVALVVTRSALAGFRNGAAVTAGIVVGDLVFVGLAILGLGALAEHLGALFAVFKFVGGAYLIWLGVGLLRAKAAVEFGGEDVRGASLAASFASGLVLTLGDLKAVLFYASLFPTVADMSSLSAAEIGAIMLITVVTVGGVKLTYAFFARRLIGHLRRRRAGKAVTKVAGGLMVGAGAWLIAKGS